MKLIRFIFACIASAVAVSCAGGNGSPLIGISCSRSGKQTNTLLSTYPDAILRAGGAPVILPTVKDSASADRIIASLDAVVFSGGEDVEPARYGEDVWNETVECDLIRDESDFLLAKAALRQGKPILGICRGEQLLNVVLGGSLYQDIPSQIPDNVGHSGTTHRIGLEKGSALALVMGEDSLTVNSFHHQAIKEPASGIRIIARAPDGVIEGFETPQVLAVQFHPEKMLREDDEWLPLFEWFVNKAR